VQEKKAKPNGEEKKGGGKIIKKRIAGKKTQQAEAGKLAGRGKLGDERIVRGIDQRRGRCGPLQLPGRRIGKERKKAGKMTLKKIMVVGLKTLRVIFLQSGEGNHLLLGQGAGREETRICVARRAYNILYGKIDLKASQTERGGKKRLATVRGCLSTKRKKAVVNLIWRLQSGS